MKKTLLFTILLVTLSTFAQVKIGDNPTTISSSSLLELESSNKGFLLPRMNTTARTAIATPATGLQVYDTDTNSIWYYNGTIWKNTNESSSGGVFVNNSTDTRVDLPYLSDGTTARPTGTEVVIKDNGSVGIGTLLPNTSAAMDISSITKGFLTPRMTAAQRDAIATPTEGLIIFNIDVQCLEIYNATEMVWKSVCGDTSQSSTEFEPICSTMSVNGEYFTGVALDASTNNITIKVDVATVGPYAIIANAGGMVFAASGTFTTTGEQQITLEGQGYPANEGLNYLSFIIGNTICSTIVNVQNGLATVGGCGTAVITGTAVAGVPLASGDLTVALGSIAYTDGTVYGISTAPDNGIALSTPLQGSFSSVSPADLEIEVLGTPVTPGNAVLNYSINKKTPCSVTIPVLSGTGFASAVACSGTLAGTYQADVAMTASNTKIVSVTVSTIGTFNIVTDTQNGVYFSGSHTATATGAQNVTLVASGTPTVSGTFSYNLNISKTATTFSTCSFNVTYAVPPGFPAYPQCDALGATYSYVKASNAQANDYFSGYLRTTPYSTLLSYSIYGNGSANKMSSDGLTLIVGAMGEDATAVGGALNNTATNSGAVYVYTRPNTTSAFVFQAYIKASNAAANDYFGNSLDISNDGNTIIVGATGEDGSGTSVNPADNNSAGASGAAYVFTRSGSTWSQLAYLKANNTAANDTFGFSVSVSGDGNTFAVGAVGEDGNSVGVNGVDNNSASRSGAVYTYTRSGSVTFNSRIKSNNIGANDYFGTSVDLNSDGTTLAVGAPAEDGSGTNVNPANNNSNTLSGAAYIFFYNGTLWEQQAYIKSSNTLANQFFGYDVSLSGSGDRLVVGAPEEDGTNVSSTGGTNSGAAYLYQRTGTTWASKQRLKADNFGASDFFGNRVQYSNDGTVVAIGAPWEDTSIPATGCPVFTANNTLANSGAVYLFKENGATFIQSAFLKMRTETSATAGNTAADYAGYSVGLSSDGKSVSIGMPGEDGSATNVNGTINNSASLSGGVLIMTTN